jgi:4-amino-4-deoxy-L-arabinose transferase-like glycosyltransferase/WD40 repeat protein
MKFVDRFKSLLKEHAPFLFLVGIAFALYAVVAWFQWCNLDEGVYLDAARTVVHGGQPFVTFAAREPGVIYYLAIGVLLFGPQLFVARMQIVIVYLLAATAVYLLGRDLKSPLAGLAAAAVLLFNPFDIYSGSIVLLEPMAAMPLAWIAYLLLRRAPPDRFKVPLLIGILFGVAELLRRDVALLLPFILVVLWWRLAPASTRTRIASTAYLVLGLAVPLGLVIGYFATATSPSWMWTEYGLGYAYFENAVPLSFHYGTLYYLLVYEPVVIIPAAIAIAGVVWAKKGAFAGFSLLAILTLIIACILMIGPANWDWGQGEYVFTYSNLLPFLLAVLWLVLVMDLLISHKHGPSMPWRVWGYCAAWVSVFLMFYTFIYPQFFTNYFGDISVPLSLLVGIWWADRIEEHSTSVHVPATTGVFPHHLGAESWRVIRISVPIAITGFLVGTAFFSAVVVLGPSNPYNEPLAYSDPQWGLVQRTYSPDLVNQVAQYLDSHSPANATLFSGDDIFIASADRSNLMSLSIILDEMAYVSYPNNATAYPMDPFGLAPSMDQLLAKWNSTWVPLVVIGERQSTMDQIHPVLGWYIKTRYHEVACFGNGLEENYVTVWALGPAPVAPATLEGSFDVGDYTASVAVDPANGTIVTGELDSPVISAVSPSGNRWSFSLPPDASGARYMAFDPATSSLWVVSSSTNVIEYSFISGSSPSTLLDRFVGYAPDYLTFDDNRGIVFVSSQAFSNVTLLNLTTGKFITNFEVASDPLAIQVDPSEGELFEASAGTGSLSIYNETTGVPITTIEIGVEPTDLLLTSNYYLLTSWNPGELVAVDRVTGSIDYTSPSGLGSVGLAASGSVVAVAGQLDGTISFFNLTTGYPMGTLQTVACPAEVEFSLDHGTIYTAGPCRSPLEAWKMVTPLTLTMTPFSGASVSLNGVPIPTGANWQVYPSQFNLETTAPGYVPLEVSVWITATSSLSPPLGVSMSDVQSVQQSFVEMCLVSAVFATFLGGVLAPMYLRKGRQ